MLTIDGRRYYVLVSVFLGPILLTSCDVQSQGPALLVQELRVVDNHLQVVTEQTTLLMKRQANQRYTLDQCTPLLSTRIYLDHAFQAITVVCSIHHLLKLWIFCSIEAGKRLPTICHHETNAPPPANALASIAKTRCSKKTRRSTNHRGRYTHTQRVDLYLSTWSTIVSSERPTRHGRQRTRQQQREKS